MIVLAVKVVGYDGVLGGALVDGVAVDVVAMLWQKTWWRWWRCCGRKRGGDGGDAVTENVVAIMINDVGREVHDEGYGKRGQG